MIAPQQRICSPGGVIEFASALASLLACNEHNAPYFDNAITVSFVQANGIVGMRVATHNGQYFSLTMKEEDALDTKAPADN